jgi:hypothetical protein
MFGRLRGWLVGIAVAGSLTAVSVTVAAASPGRDLWIPTVQPSVVTGHAAKGGLPMFIFGSYHGLRPRSIYFSGDGGNIVGNLRWSNWTLSHATGEGQSDMQGCIPDCATGAEILVPTLITLRDPVDGYFTRIIERRDGQNTTFFYKHKPARGSFPQSSYAPGPAGPATSLEYYWGDIDTGAYARAWTYLSATVESEAAFVDGEDKARPTNIELLGTLADISGNHATIVVNRSITHDQQYRCRSWSGHYSMDRAGGHWLVASAQITPKAC